jgi:putative redox protein
MMAEAAMLEVVTKHLGAVQFEVSARNHRIYSDQPVEGGGFDEGMTPPELMLGSLGACAGYYAVDYLQRAKVPADGLRVRTTAEKVAGPPRLDDIRIELECPGVVEERHRKGLLETVRKCLIHNTLLHTPRIRLDFVVPAVEKAA